MGVAELEQKAGGENKKTNVWCNWVDAHSNSYYCKVSLQEHTQMNHLHELKGSLKVLHGIHLDPEELHAHDETDDALNHEGALLLLPQLL